MVKIVLAIAVLGQMTIDWNPKEIELPRDHLKVKFPIYNSAKSAGYSVAKVLLVWVPRNEMFPDLQPRQALRITLKDRTGNTIDLVQSPKGASDCSRNLREIIGQGYVDILIRPRVRFLTERSGTCIGFYSDQKNGATLVELSKHLELMKK